MFILMMHLTHFYLQLYGVRLMVKDHSDNDIEWMQPLHGLLFLLASKDPLYAPSHRHDTTAFNIPAVDQCLELEIIHL